jgi:hypothetical protein
MLIGSKLPPNKVNVTYFNSGRAAFAYLLSDVISVKKIYLPTFICWSLVNVMEKLYPAIKVEFYNVNRKLECNYPAIINEEEALVFIHYFGHENTGQLPINKGIILEDMSHAYLSSIFLKGDYIFGSLRKLIKVGDGGFINGFYNPIYEPSRKLDTWLRYEAKDWRDVREAENMMDREITVSDMSSQSLAVILQSNIDLIKNARTSNNVFLDTVFPVGTALLKFRINECPMVHNRLFNSTEERDSLRTFLASKGIFTSIHWPTHRRVIEEDRNVDITDTLWLEQRLLSIPISEDYNLNDMEFICEQAQLWKRSGT